MVGYHLVIVSILFQVLPITGKTMGQGIQLQIEVKYHVGPGKFYKILIILIQILKLKRIILNIKFGIWNFKM